MARFSSSLTIYRKQYKLDNQIHLAIKQITNGKSFFNEIDFWPSLISKHYEYYTNLRIQITHRFCDVNGKIAFNSILNDFKSQTKFRDYISCTDTRTTTWVVTTSNNTSSTYNITTPITWTI